MLDILLEFASSILYIAPMSKRDCIIKARSERGLSVDELAKLSGVPRTTLYSYFKGTDMRGTAVEAVERALGIGTEQSSQTRLRPDDTTWEPQHAC